MRRLKGTSLLEAIVAAVLFLTVFAVVMELLPGLAVRSDDALLVAEAEYRTGQAFEKYASGLWPCGDYVEQYDWGRVSVRVERYRGDGKLRLVTITACIEGCRKRIVHKQLAECRE